MMVLVAAKYRQNTFLFVTLLHSNRYGLFDIELWNQKEPGISRLLRHHALSNLQQLLLPGPPRTCPFRRCGCFPRS